jgi:hypothetical protein
MHWDYLVITETVASIELQQVGSPGLGARRSGLTRAFRLPLFLQAPGGCLISAIFPLRQGAGDKRAVSTVTVSAGLWSEWSRVYRQQSRPRLQGRLFAHLGHAALSDLSPL